MRFGVGHPDVFTGNQPTRGPRRRIRYAAPFAAPVRRSRARALPDCASQPYQYSPAFRKRQGQGQDRPNRRGIESDDNRSRAGYTERSAGPLLHRERRRRRNRWNERKSETTRRPAGNREQPARHAGESSDSEFSFSNSEVGHSDRAWLSSLTWIVKQNDSV